MAKGYVNVKNVNQSDIDDIDLTLDNIKALIGQTGNTGGSASAGTIMAKLNKLLTDWTSTRAGYIDKLANFGTTGETGGSTTSGTMMAKLNKLLGDWTTTRAGYINTINTNTSRLTTT